jgi:hypothetical protein
MIIVKVSLEAREAFGFLHAAARREVPDFALKDGQFSFDAPHTGLKKIALSS